MEKEGRPAVEVVLTVLHSGGKFGEGEGYKVSGGLHGVGVSVVNALSERLVIEIRRDGHLWTQEYSRGAPLGPLVKGAALPKNAATGTSITFHPDPEIFELVEFNTHTLEERLRRDGVSHARPADHADRRARRRQRGRVLLRGWHRGLRRLPKSEQGARRQEDHLLLRRERGGGRRGRDAVETAPTRSRSSPSPTTSTRMRAAAT